MQLMEMTYVCMRLKCLAIMKAVTDSATVVYTQQFSCYAVHTPMHMHLHTKAAWFECMSWGCV